MESLNQIKVLGWINLFDPHVWRWRAKEKRRRPEVRAISNTDGPESMVGVKGRSIT